MSSAQQIGQGDDAVDGREGDDHRDERPGEDAEPSRRCEGPQPAERAGTTVEGGRLLGDRYADVTTEGPAWSSDRCSGRLAPTGEQETHHRERDDERRADGEIVDGDCNE